MKITIDTEKGIFIVPNTFFTEIEKQNKYLKKAGVPEEKFNTPEKVITEAFEGLDPLSIPAALVVSHGPFTWGKNAAEAVYHAVVLEEIARMARLTRQIDNTASEAPTEIRDKHYLRKHGKDAYYGQQNR